VFTKVFGKTENSMVKENIFFRMGLLKLVSGSGEKELIGLMSLVEVLEQIIELNF
jgi:hypothetical protein